MAYHATIKFLGDWRQEQEGAIERDGRLSHAGGDMVSQLLRNT